MKNLFTTLTFLLIATFAFAQSTISGKIMDAETGDPLIGASVLVIGTSQGTITDFDGSFTLQTDLPSGKINISYTGYESQSLDFNGTTTFDNIELGASAFGLEEVVVTGVMDIVRDRRTPVAVSTITTAEIQAKGGNVEFPELMKSTPSIYVAGQAGGYGDSEVFTRGFDQTNTAFLLNGQPINGMEDGRMYWSNWSGMTDVANAIQIQRGLGSSKLAISSVGGTVNIIMKPTELKQGGNVSYLLGNDQYNKVTASYNTGLINDKFGVSVLLTHWQGNGWADGTKGQGQNYFVSAGYKPNSRNTFNFLLTGAPQYHDQNFNKRISDHFQDGEFNIKFNNNYGFLDGEYYSLRRNFYHKPVANLNWDFAINDKSSLSTVLYASWGRGGGSGDIGNRNNRFYTEEGLIDWDAVQAANIEDAGEEEWVVRNSVNNHSWYGLVSKYETNLSDALNLSVGADLRTYRGSHFRELRDLMGAPAYTQRANARFGEREVTATFEANPWAALSNFAEIDERIAYNNDETISYAGVFGQLEYAPTGSALTGFVQGAVSNQSYVRYELFNQTEENEESQKVTELGYNLKGGFSVATGENGNFFVNAGYYQRQPFLDNIFLAFSNFVNELTVSEKIFGLEAGYKFQTRNFAANVNVYRTSWKDRATTQLLTEGDEIPNGTLVGVGDWYRIARQNQLHTGIELDFSYKINDMFRLKGYSSLGDWAFDGSLASDYYNDNREVVFADPGTDVDGVKVGGAAQTSFGLGLDIKATEGLKFDIDYNFYDKLHSNIGAGNTSLELPSFGLLDLGASYNFALKNDQLLTLRANLFNALGEEYISRATSSFEASDKESENWNGVNMDNFVTFGKTRTWNVSLRYSF